MSFDERTNLLLIQDEPQSIQRIKALVAEMDKPIEQIAIEARIVTMTDESLQELGVRWGYFKQQNRHILLREFSRERLFEYRKPIKCEFLDQ